MGGAFPEATDGNQTSGSFAFGNGKTMIIPHTRIHCGELFQGLKIDSWTIPGLFPSRQPAPFNPPPATVTDKHPEDPKHILSRSAASEPAAGRGEKG